MSQAFAKEAVVRLASSIDLCALELSVQEGFVLSRIDGFSSVHTLCQISGLGEQPTLLILGRLWEQGLILVGDQAGVTSSSHRSMDDRIQSDEIPTAERPVIVSIPDAVFDDASSTEYAAVTEETPTISKRSPVLDSEKVDTQEATPSVRATAVTDLSQKQQTRIREMFERLDELNFFEILSTTPQSSTKELRRSYFSLSKEFHPDRFFNKNLGDFKSMIQKIFKQINSAYKFLENEEQRTAYSKMLEEQRAQEALAIEVERQGARVLACPPTGNSGLAQKEVSSEYFFIKSKHHRGSERGLPVQDTPQGDAKEETTIDNMEQEAGRREKDRFRRRQRISSTVSLQYKRAKEFYDQGMQQLDEGQTLAAAASFKLAAALNPGEETYLRMRNETIAQSAEATAEIYCKQAAFEESVERWEVAERLFIKAAGLVPKCTYLIKAAQAKLRSQQLIEAKEYATKAVLDAPQSIEARLTMAQVCEAAGLIKNALREIQEAARLAPDNEDIRKKLKELKKVDR